MGWLAAILVGAVVGALAQASMRGDIGVAKTMLAGIVGALLANVLFLVWEVHLGDSVSFMSASVVGAPFAIGVTRMLRARPVILE